MTLPNKFEFCTAFNRAEKYIMEKYEEGMYRIAGEGYTAAHTAAFVEACVNEGSWIITRNMDEPEMKFPIFCTHSDPQCQAEDYPESAFRIDKGNTEGFVKVTWRDGSVQTNFWTVDNCTRLIKEGIWIVKHVGEKSAVKTGYKGSIDGYDLATGLSWKGGELKIENPTIVNQPSTTLSNLAIKIDSSQVGEATDNIKALAEAYEYLAIAMQHVINLNKEIFNV